MPGSRTGDAERADAWADFDAAMARPVFERIARGCLWTFKPVLDEGPGVRVFDTMDDYRKWCQTEIPAWLGYARVTESEWRGRVERASRDPGRVWD